MATKTVSTVQECVISKAVESSSDKYSPDTLMRYHTTLALIDSNNLSVQQQYSGKKLSFGRF